MAAGVWTVEYSHSFEREASGLLRLIIRLTAELNRPRWRSVCRPLPGVSLYTRSRLRPWARVLTNRRTGRRTLSAGLLYFAVTVSLPAACWWSGHWWCEDQVYGEPPHQEALARVCRRCEHEESL